MIKVAITGNIAAGKSTVEKILREQGYSVLNTDDVGHDLLDGKSDVFKSFPFYIDVAKEVLRAFKGWIKAGTFAGINLGNWCFPIKPCSDAWNP